MDCEKSMDSFRMKKDSLPDYFLDDYFCQFFINFEIIIIIMQNKCFWHV